MDSSWEQLDGEDAYEVLGVSDDATPEQIVTAYRKQIKRSHPDVSDDRDAEARTRRLNAAYRILKYDRAAYRILKYDRAAYDDYQRRSTEWESVRLPPEPWDEEPPDLWDEPPDDPWDEIPDDPWEGAETGPQPPRHQQHPMGYPPPPPTAPIYQPWPPSYEPFVTHRRRIRWGGILAVSLILLVGCTAALFNSAVQGSRDLSPEPSASVPTRYAGTWRGSITDKGKNEQSWRTVFILHSGKRNGEVNYLSGECRGTAVPVSYRANRLRVNTSFAAGLQGCDVGDAYLTRRQGGRLDVVYYDDSGKVSAAGVLTRRP